MSGKKTEISNSIFHKVVPLLNTQMYLNSWQICKFFLKNIELNEYLEIFYSKSVKHRIVELNETKHFLKFGENVELNEGRTKRDDSVCGFLTIWRTTENTRFPKNQ